MASRASRRSGVRATAARPAALGDGPGSERDGCPRPASVLAWFAARGWSPFDYQIRAWDAYAAGRSGLVRVPTGAGKTYAAFGGPLQELIDGAGVAGDASPRAGGLRVLYITPLRAVSRDIELALRAPIEAMGLACRVESRTGDTSSSARVRQRERLPEVLVTTPESLSLMLTWPDAPARFAGLRCVIVDEWHELLTSKRGTQVELALARLRSFAPALRTWALSATISNADEAARAIVGAAAEDPVIVTTDLERRVLVDTVLPEPGDPFPWAGHLGLSMLERVVESIDPSRSTLIFTNTRSQSERWFQAILSLRPEWERFAGLHHGSIDRERREEIERGLKNGSIRLVVATSSLDLGVDFAPVERVLQIGSPKGIARLMQRAGRAAHRPGEDCRITCVPTHGLELLEVAAVRMAMARGEVEPRRPAEKPLDVLAQHIVTCAMGGGFMEDELFEQVRAAWSYRELSRAEFDWTLSLVREGGQTLRAYPHYHRVRTDEHGRHAIASPRLAAIHRLNVGTIVGEATMTVAWSSGRTLGQIEENFVAGLRPGDKFVFAGRVVEFSRVHDMTAIVRPAKGTTNFTPIWSGTRLPISESMGRAMRELLERSATGDAEGPEMQAARPLVRAMLQLSHVPRADEVLCELCDTREGSHLFVYPFDGRLVHAGIAALLAYRISRRVKATFSIASNDYGFELLAPAGFDFGPHLAADSARELLDAAALWDDVDGSVNLAELARHQFREIARVSGLVQQSYPGARKGARQTQANAGLIFDVFREFDPRNLLLEQARREVFDRQFERSRLSRTLARLQRSKLAIRRVARPTPLGLPLVIERVGGRLSSQSLADRVEQMKAAWERDLASLGTISRQSRRANSPRAPGTTPATRPSSRAKSPSS